MTMKKLILSLVLGGLAFTSHAQTSVWKVSKNGNDMYLGGSVHALRPSDHPIPKAFETAYNKAEKVVFETDMKQLKSPETQQLVMAKGMIQGDKTVKDLLNKEAYEALDKTCTAMSIPLGSLSKFKPSLLMVSLVAMKMQQAGINAEGIDSYIYKKASEDKKGLGILESVESQVNVITTMGEENPNKYVLLTIKDLNNTTADFDKLVSDWRTGSNKYMVDKMTEMQETLPGMYDALLSKRNAKWMPQIEAFLKDKPVEFVVVGALHLHGPEGLLTVLKAKGYSIEQMN